MKYSRGLNRVYGLLCGIWFLAWLVAFPLYTRSKDLKCREFWTLCASWSPNRICGHIWSNPRRGVDSARLSEALGKWGHDGRSGG